MSKVGSCFRPTVLLLTTAHDRVRPNLLEDRRDPTAIRIELEGGPGLRVWAGDLPGVLGLDADEAAIPGRDALPVALSRVIASAGGHDEERAITPNARTVVAAPRPPAPYGFDTTS
jgi:hypothetical protein